MADPTGSSSTAGGIPVSQWPTTFKSLDAEWSEVWPATSGPAVDMWPVLFEGCLDHQTSLARQGRWFSSQRDLLHVLGYEDRELVHSALVAWLLRPEGRHGLGQAVLGALLKAGWPDLPLEPDQLIVVEREVPRGATYADVVVRFGDAVLVVENKIWSPEHPGQCEALYREWGSEGRDVRWLLLTPSGRPPASTRTAAAADAWRSLSYSHLAGLLADLLHARAGTDDGGRSSVEQYVACIAKQFGTRRPFVVRPGGGHVG